jgi:peptidoglycan-N-acetylglucosamine deacetylase
MKVTLTFDNGPSEVTGAVLDVLAAHGVKATFFVVGSQLAALGGRAVVERAKADGHWIGNHTSTHTVMFGDSDDPELPAQEIGHNQDLIGSLAHPDKLFRPYCGGGILDDRVFSPSAIDYLCRHDYTCVLWNNLPHDWDLPDQWIQRCLNDVRAQDWSVVVVHDLPTGAMQHLPTFLNGIERLGADVVQGFPDACLPIRNGAQVGDLTHLTRQADVSL